MQAQREGFGEQEKKGGGQTRPWESSIRSREAAARKEDTNWPATLVLLAYVAGQDSQYNKSAGRVF